MAKTDEKCIVFVVISIIFIAILIYVFTRSRVEGYRPTTIKDPINRQRFMLYYFYHPSCGYCQQFNPVWDELSKKYHSSNLRKIDATDSANENLTFYYNVTAYPTIILVSGNKNKRYSGNRSIDDIQKFISDNSS